MPVKYIARQDGFTPGGAPQDNIFSLCICFTATARDPVDSNILVADRDYEIVKVVEVHSTAAAGGATLDLKKCSGTTAPASGTTVLASTFALDSTANTPIAKTPGFNQTGVAAAVAGSGITTTQANRRLTANDRLAIDVTGTTTAYVGMVQVHLRPIFGSNDQVGF